MGTLNKLDKCGVSNGKINGENDVGVISGFLALNANLTVSELYSKPSVSLTCTTTLGNCGGKNRKKTNWRFILKNKKNLNKFKIK